LLFAETEENDFAHCFKKAAEEARKSGHTVKPPLNGINLGFHVCRVSDPSPETMKRFIDALAESVPWVAEATGGRRLGIYELVQGELAFYKGSLDEAQKGLLLAREKGGKNGHFEIENRALFYLLRIHLCRGDAKGAEGVLKQIEAGMEEHSNYSYSRNFHFDIVTGWYYIQLGMKSRIAPWLRSDYAGSGLDSGSRCLEKLVKARYYLAEKRYPAALASLETRADTEVFLMGRIEMKALEAVIRFRLVDKEGAYTALREACDLAAPQGFFMPFTELGRDIRSLAETAQKENAPGIKQEWLLRIRRSAAIYAKKLYNFTGQAGTGRIRSLSRRETAVLIGLSQGLTREEIAGAGSISPNTVKSVTRNIYNKLGALNHADAVRIATERGIL
jgi:LuxR family maltose regulon positive regulatory protein